MFYRIIVLILIVDCHICRSKYDPNVNVSWIYQQIEHLGKLYDYKSTYGRDDPQAFQDFLERYDVPKETGIFNTFDRMFMVW